MRLAGLVLALCAQASLFAQTASVPFVGCVSYGQANVVEPPKGTSKSVSVSAKDAQALAWYTSADGDGLLAPRGWYCEGFSCSSGAMLVLSPQPIDRHLTSSEGFSGPAIEVDHTNWQSSGRYQIAEVVLRLFPAYRAFATRTMEAMELSLPSDPYPKDTLRRKSKTVVEYDTSAHTEGLEKQSWPKKNGSSISGVAILIGDPPDLLLLSVRLPPNLSRLTPLIVHHLESDSTHQEQ